VIIVEENAKNTRWNLTPINPKVDTENVNIEKSDKCSRPVWKVKDARNIIENVMYCARISKLFSRQQRRKTYMRNSK
jgi:hypothetical protein